ncbi:YheU family protein [Leminorella grimontii]|uniref:YheU family protein n=1 Tax=Leminorella grimontii TaxID=82981 RepID=UPI00208C9384|nr:YheU family protein [Leminorella grimontii]GKX59312.1 UPF0270 protein YheU [Leminorella grimontii]
MIIPWQSVNPDTLEAIIESFVLREGTDYGEQEKSLPQKVEDVKHLLKSGEAVLVWSQLHETVNIMMKAQFKDNNETEYPPEY